jgi:hypothetical protein
MRADMGVPRSRVLGLAALAILGVATAPLTLITGLAASGAVLLAVAIADTVQEATAVAAPRCPTRDLRRIVLDPGLGQGVHGRDAPPEWRGSAGTQRQEAAGARH